MRGAQKTIYCFITDENQKFCRATQQFDGSYVITKNAQPYPIKYNPVNLLEVPVEFATNLEYNSLVRSIGYPLKFVKDGAAILRDFYHMKKGIEQNCFLTIVEWNGVTGVYELSYYGKIDFGQKNEDAKAGMFTCSTIDDSAWGVLSNNDKTEYAVDCSATNPKAIRVLFDGLTLKNNYTFQTVASPIVYNGDAENTGRWTLPLVLINQDGDSSGLTVKNQNLFYLDDDNFPPNNNSQGWCFDTAYEILNMTLEGSFEFVWNSEYTGDPLLLRAGVTIKMYTTAEPGFPNGQTYSLVGRSYLQGPFINGRIYKFNFNVASFNLSAGAKIFIVIEIGETYNTHSNIIVTPIASNIVISTLTVPEPVVRYGLRPLDFLQELVSKATNGRHTINSLFFVENNKSIIFSGDSLRGIPNAKVYSSFNDFFTTFDAINFMALRNINGGLWMELHDEVYRQDSTILDIGDAVDVKTEPAADYFVNEIEIGAPDIDLRHPSGRLEFNTTNKFSLNIQSVKNKASLITKYRLGCYDITFLILDYQGNSTQDNSGDKQVYVAQITDDKGMAMEDIETFETINVDNVPLEPIIKSPRDNDTITFDLPVIRGVAPVGENVNIYVDNVLDGNATVDVDGNWSYNIVNPLTPYEVGVETGIHVIDATYTDLSAPKSTITVFIDTSVTTDAQILYPEHSSNLYNNKPLIRGIAQKDQNIDISLDGVLIASVVADASCKWEYKVTVPFTNAQHTISINANTDSVTFEVDSNVTYPLITYIGSELDGFILVNNLPLIEGVAIPGTVVDLWLDYINFPGSRLGQAIADANGNWSYQVVPVSYLDPSSGIPVVIAPIKNGLSIISTSLVNHTVSISVVGYLLERPNFSSITGVIDNTVFNTKYSPKRMLMARKSLWASVLAKTPQEKIYFQKSLKNDQLRTVLDGVVVDESDDVTTSSLGTPFALLEYAIITTKTSTTFAKTLYNFNNGGIVKTRYRGQDLFCLPIGSMKMMSIKSDVQEWKLLMSPLTTYSSLLNLYKNGTTIQIMRNSIYINNYNTLHFVAYDFQINPKYHIKEIYEEWFNDRNEKWILNPLYVQKIQRTDPCRHQIISNGLSNLSIRIFKCKDAKLVGTVLYEPITPAPIPAPEIVLEAVIDWTDYPEDQYFGVLYILDTPIAICERVQTKDDWPGTILIEANSTINQVGAFFSSGFRSVLRVEGHVKKWQPEVDTSTSREQDGDTLMLYSSAARKRVIRFGTAYGLPDYLYLKIAEAIILDDWKCENVYYTLQEGEKITPSDDIDGHPLFYYNVNVDLKTNERGLVVSGDGDDNGRQGVILVIDAVAFGLPTGSLINIELVNE